VGQGGTGRSEEEASLCGDRMGGWNCKSGRSGECPSAVARDPVPRLAILAISSATVGALLGPAPDVGPRLPSARCIEEESP